MSSSKDGCNMKRGAAIVIFLILTFVFCFNSFAERSEMCWYCLRSGNRQPNITREEKLISSYGGISVDRSVNDSSDRKVIYLTFDAGYENGNTEKIVDAMNERGVKGAFFILSNFVLKNKELTKKIADSGHTVCNHTSKHENISDYTKEMISECLGRLEAVYTECTGRKMTKFFRFPEGKYSESALQSINELGYTPVLWSFAYEDWNNGKQPSEDGAIKKILDNTHNGAIFLFHPTSETNARIFPRLLDTWRDMGYSFGTLDQI